MVERFLGKDAFDGSAVGFSDMAAGVSQVMEKTAVVGQEQQPFGICV
jgi:hypothetical protein